MKRLLAVPVTLLLLVSLAVAAGPVPKSVVEASVTVVSPNYGSGSGTVVVDKNGSVWVLTAAHVVAGLREESEALDAKTGAKKTKVLFKDAKIVRFIVENGRTVGRVELDAEVVRYSSVDHHDLALLKLRRGAGEFTSSATFWLDKEIPDAGTELYHVGSLLGEFGSNSLTAGIVSRPGRVLYGYTFDQVSCPCFAGSSGGGVFLKSDGRYVGMVTRGAGETFTLMVPVRRINVWTKQVGIGFVLDPSLPVPDATELGKLPIEDNLKE